MKLLRGFSPQEVLSQTVAEVMTPESLTYIQENLPDAIKRYREGKGKPYHITHIDQFHRDGSIIPTEVVISFLPDAQGVVTRILGVSRNISERLATEEKLKNSERYCRILSESMNVVFAILDPDTLMHRYISPSIEGLLGYTSEEFLALPFDQIINPSSVNWLREEALRRMVEFRATSDCEQTYIDEFELIDKSGLRVPVESRSRLIYNEESGDPEIISIARRMVMSDQR